jgi:5-formyltetrahydrofolate cyclo-ligase
MDLGAPRPAQHPEKQALRARLVPRRAQLEPAARAAFALDAAARLAALPALGGARVVALYAPLGAEIDPSSLVPVLLARGIRVVYPRVRERDRRLVFAECAPADLVRGPLSALEPPATLAEADAAEIGALVIPAVAFSVDGFRLGRGGGFYDATLAAIPGAARLGFAFDFQVVPEVPREAHDALMDAVVTERRTLLFQRDTLRQAPVQDGR